MLGREGRLGREVGNLAARNPREQAKFLLKFQIENALDIWDKENRKHFKVVEAHAEFVAKEEEKREKEAQEEQRIAEKKARRGTTEASSGRRFTTTGRG